MFLIKFYKVYKNMYFLCMDIQEIVVDIKNTITPICDNFMFILQIKLTFNTYENVCTMFINYSLVIQHIYFAICLLNYCTQYNENLK